MMTKETYRHPDDLDSFDVYKMGRNTANVISLFKCLLSFPLR